MNKLSKKGLGIAFGVIEAVFVFLSWLVGTFSMNSDMIEWISDFYIGFNASFVGLLIGLVEAFVVGWIAGYLVAAVYNRFSSGDE